MQQDNFNFDAYVNKNSAELETNENFQEIISALTDFENLEEFLTYDFKDLEELSKIETARYDDVSI